MAAQPSGKQFDFNELQIFSKFELFCKRVQKLIFVFSTVEQFGALEKAGGLPLALLSCGDILLRTCIRAAHFQ